MIIDTSVYVSAFERGDAAARDAIAAATVEQQPGCRVVLGELESGPLTAGDDTAKRHRTTTLTHYALTHEFSGEGVDEARMARLFAELTATCRTEGLRVGQNDRWVVAEAMYWARELLTADDGMYRLAELHGVTVLRPGDIAGTGTFG